MVSGDTRERLENTLERQLGLKTPAKDVEVSSDVISFEAENPEDVGSDADQFTQGMVDKIEYFLQHNGVSYRVNITEANVGSNGRVSARYEIVKS